LNLKLGDTHRPHYEGVLHTQARPIDQHHLAEHFNANCARDEHGDECRMLALIEQVRTYPDWPERRPGCKFDQFPNVIAREDFRGNLATHKFAISTMFLFLQLMTTFS
jgi:hypothetical protein